MGRNPAVVADWCVQEGALPLFPIQPEFGGKQGASESGRDRRGDEGVVKLDQAVCCDWFVLLLTKISRRSVPNYGTVTVPDQER